MEKENIILKKELESKKISKKYRNNIQRKKVNFLLYALFFLMIVFITLVTLILMSLSNKYYLQTFALGDGTILISSLLLFSYFIKITTDKILKVIKNRHSEKLKKLNWVDLFRTYNDNEFIVQKISLNKLYIDDYLFCNLLLNNKIETIEINNKFKINFKGFTFSINHCNLFFDKKDNLLKLAKKITFSSEITSDEIKSILNKDLNVVEIRKDNTFSTSIVVNSIICSKEEIIGSTKNGISYLKIYDFDITKEILGLYSQKKYNKNNFLEVYNEYILTDIKTIKNILLLNN
ncbi:hypothetical protein [Spiroplasma endosymbiont of Cantharis rufa]|uniref:hypothetical protein n=1 Tax=Spiroplasma endosymbiont of Cantharis rufa TaxID=3066279 RepID=UPI0030CAE612